MATDQFGLPVSQPSTLTKLTSSIPVIGSLVPVASSLTNALGITKPNKDPGRFATNAQLYSQALAGDISAYKRLSCLAGEQTYRSEFNQATVPCGWGTQAAKDDAQRYLNDIRARGIFGTGQNTGNGQTLGTSPIPMGNGFGGVSFPGESGSGAAPAASMGGTMTAWLIIVGLAAFAVYVRPKK